jgi:hypothetical protein
MGGDGGDGDGGDDGLGSGSGGSRGVSMDKVKRIDYDFDVDADQQRQRQCLKKRRRDLDDDDDEDDDVVDVDGKHVVDRWDARVKVGDRLEVQWEVVRDEDYDDVEEANERRVRVKWWPCVVVRGDEKEDEAKMSRSETTSFGLVYDAMDGFDSERRRVVFSRAGGARQLEHAGEAGVFRWRREGDVDDVQHDDSDDEDDCDDAENAIEDAPTTMREILEAQGAIDAENGGVSLESAAMGAFATLPMNQQMNMATAFAGFKEKLMTKLSGLAAEKGAEGVVTKDDIDGILSDIQKGA